MENESAMAVPVHEREFERLNSLCGLRLPENGTECLYDEIASQAAMLCGATYGLVSIVGEHEQRYLGNRGLPGEGTPRDGAICAYTILDDAPLVVEDTQKDPRFQKFASVQGTPFLRFYAGAPILDRGGLPLGSVCVLDTVPREIQSGKLIALQRLASVVGVILESRRFVIEMLGPNPHPVALQDALHRLDNVLRPLYGPENGFKSFV